MPEQQNFHEEFSLRILPACDIQNTVHIGDECPIEITNKFKLRCAYSFNKKLWNFGKSWICTSLLSGIGLPEVAELSYRAT
jgi:hypothetical protein